ncbi:hypothetical protein ACVWZM_002802 [Bradyrhizobium sp. USDA 4501]
MRAESCVTVSSTWLAKEDHRHFDDRKQQSEKQRRDHREFDRGRATAVSAKAMEEAREKMSG